MTLPDLGQMKADDDAAQRISDAVNLHLVANFEEAIRGFVAIDLADGSAHQGTLFDDWHSAMAVGERTGHHVPLKITPDGINKPDALKWLRTVRKLKDLGMAIGRGEDLQSNIFLPGGEKRSMN